MSLPLPLIYLPLTYAPTNTTITQTNITSTNYDPNYGIVFNDIQTSGGSKKAIGVPKPDGLPRSLNTTVCFNMYIGNYFPGNQQRPFRVFSQGNPSDPFVKESIHLDINSDKKLVLTLNIKGAIDQVAVQIPGNGSRLITNMALTPNTWYFVAYTITGSACNVDTGKCTQYQVKLYVNNKTSNIKVQSHKGNENTQQNNLSWNGVYQSKSSTPINQNIQNINYDRFQIGDSYTTSTGYALNGCIRDFMIFGANIDAPIYNSIVGDNLIKMSSSNLPTPPTTFGTAVTSLSNNTARTLNPIYPALTPSSIAPFSYISALQRLINYLPPPNISLPLTTAPLSTIATVNSGTTITYDTTKGAIFPNKSAPTLNGTTTNNYINIPTTSDNNLTVSFPIYLNYINTNSLRILTLGNVSGNTSNEVLSINSNYLSGTGQQTISNLNCSTNPRTYTISATINNTAANQNTIINQNTPPVIKTPSVTKTPSPSVTNVTNIYRGQQFSVNECTWNLVTLVLNSSNITLYINNNVCTSVTIPSGFTYNTIRLGDTFSNSSICFVGNLKNLMIYNNVFTADNIKFLHNKYILNTPSSATVALHFDQNDIPLLENNVETLENNVETFINMQSSNTFVKYTRLFSIVGVLFYAVILLGNMNYEKIIPNKNVSFGLNVLLVTSILIALIN